MADEDEGMPQQITEEDLKKMSPEQIRELQKRSCVFCQIISGKIPSKKVYDDDVVFAILDINPANPGHILLMPMEHHMILPQMPAETTSHLFVAAKHLSMACIKALKVQGTNIFVANGAAAGQKAQHFMAHVIPRKGNDALTCFTLPKRQIAEDQLQKLNQVLRARIEQTLNAKQGVTGQGSIAPAAKNVPARTTAMPQSVPPLAKAPAQMPQAREEVSSSLDLDSLTEVLTGQSSGPSSEDHEQDSNEHEPSPAQEKQSSLAVYASRQGKKFHLQNCPFLQRIVKKSRKNVSLLTESDIRKRELKPCVCVTSIVKGA